MTVVQVVFCFSTLQKSCEAHYIPYIYIKTAKDCVWPQLNYMWLYIMCFPGRSMGFHWLERPIRKWSIFWRSSRCMFAWFALAFCHHRFLTVTRKMRTLSVSPWRSCWLSLTKRWKHTPVPPQKKSKNRLLHPVPVGQDIHNMARHLHLPGHPPTLLEDKQNAAQFATTTTSFTFYNPHIMTLLKVEAGRDCWNCEACKWH